MQGDGVKDDAGEDPGARCSDLLGSGGRRGVCSRSAEGLLPLLAELSSLLTGFAISLVFDYLFTLI